MKNGIRAALFLLCCILVAFVNEATRQPATAQSIGSRVALPLIRTGGQAVPRLPDVTDLHAPAGFSFYRGSVPAATRVGEVIYWSAMGRGPHGFGQYVIRQHPTGHAELVPLPLIASERGQLQLIDGELFVVTWNGEGPAKLIRVPR